MKASRAEAALVSRLAACDDRRGVLIQRIDAATARGCESPLAKRLWAAHAQNQRRTIALLHDYIDLLKREAQPG